jgi:hypothetical protein
MSHAAATANSDTVFYSSTDNYIKKNTKAGMLASLGLNGVTPTISTAAPSGGVNGDVWYQYV